MKLKTLLNNLEDVNVIVLTKQGNLLQEIFVSDYYYGECKFEDGIIDKITTLVNSDNLFVYLKRW